MSQKFPKSLLTLHPRKIEYLLHKDLALPFYYSAKQRYEYSEVARDSDMPHFNRLVTDRAKRLEARHGGMPGMRQLAILELQSHRASRMYELLGQHEGAYLTLPREYVERHPWLHENDFVVLGDNGDDELTFRAHAFECPCCDSWQLQNGSSSVRVALHSSQRWCNSCVEDESFYCDMTGRNYSQGEMTAGQTHGGEVVCEEWASANDWYQDDDGYWSDEAPEDRDDYIPDYHSARRPDFTPIPMFRSVSDRTYGIELEVEFRSEENRREFFSENFASSGLSSCANFAAERDGSLDDELGLEIIGRPMRLAEYYAKGSPWEAMCKKLYDHDAYGWSVRADYGMHVNVDVRPPGMTVAQAHDNHDELRKRMAAINAMLVNNRELTAKLAGRHLPFEASLETVQHLGVEKAKKLASLAESAAQIQHQKYVFAAPKGVHVLEVRIFGSNVKYAGIRRNIEYVDSIVAYTLLSEAHLFDNMTFSAYWRWLRRPENRNRWPFLAAYLDPKITDENRDIKLAVR